MGILEGVLLEVVCIPGNRKMKMGDPRNYLLHHHLHYRHLNIEFCFGSHVAAVVVVAAVDAVGIPVEGCVDVIVNHSDDTTTIHHHLIVQKG